MLWRNDAAIIFNIVTENLLINNDSWKFPNVKLPALTHRGPSRIFTKNRSYMIVSPRLKTGFSQIFFLSVGIKGIV